jgi:hypothetical protein
MYGILRAQYGSVPRAVASGLQASAALATARGTDPVSLPVRAIAIRSKFQGREFRLTDMEGVVVNKLLA